MDLAARQMVVERVMRKAVGKYLKTILAASKAFRVSLFRATESHKYVEQVTS
jgi:hypothetical protein